MLGRDLIACAVGLLFVAALACGPFARAQIRVACLGDSITYGPQTTTEYRNPGPTPCELLLVIDSSKVGG